MDNHTQTNERQTNNFHFQNEQQKKKFNLTRDKHKTTFDTIGSSSSSFIHHHNKDSRSIRHVFHQSMVVVDEKQINEMKKCTGCFLSHSQSTVYHHAILI